MLQDIAIGFGDGEIFLNRIQTVVSGKAFFIAVYEQTVFPRHDFDAVTGVRILTVKVEKQPQITAFKSDYLVGVIKFQLAYSVLPYIKLFEQLQHGTVKFAQSRVKKLRIIRQSPLPPGVVIAPVIAFAGEIYSFGMTELVAHKIQISAA